MDPTIRLSVYRRLDNRLEGLADDSVRAKDLHERRRRALHEVFDGRSGVRVDDWGETDDPGPHELVHLAIGVLASATFKYAIAPGLKLLGEKLVDKGVDEGASELVKWVISKLRGKQLAKEVQDFELRLADGTVIRCDPPEGKAEMTITFAGGKVERISYATRGGSNDSN